MISLMRASAKTLHIFASAFLLFTLGCTTTGYQVTQEEINREAQRLQTIRQQGTTREPSPFARMSLAQQKQVVTEMGARLLKYVEEPLKIDFEVMEDDKSVNAGATFGKIVVTTGMLRFIKSDDELAIVLGHEIAHIAKGHLMKTIVSSIPVIVGSKAAETISPGSGKMIEIGGGIFAQKYSRDMEREADHFGILYAHNAGFDAAAGVEIWERFAIELPESQSAGLFSSHPSSIERTAHARKMAHSLQGR